MSLVDVETYFISKRAGRINAYLYPESPGKMREYSPEHLLDYNVQDS
jgi:hypothetical protein